MWTLPNITIMNINLQKAFSTRNGHRATMRLNIFNALNANPITGRTMASGPNFGIPTSVLTPRIVELSLAYQF